MLTEAVQRGSASALMKNAGTRARVVYTLWIAAILALFLLHFVHVLADFPNNSPWMDYAKYTDEGWYGSAAARYILSGHWYLRGDFNPAVAVPVWPLLLTAVFSMTGVSLAAARAAALTAFGLNLLLSYCIVRTRSARWVALLAVTILAASPFLYAFSRLAILEPLAMSLLLLSWMLALRLARASGWRRSLLLGAIGMLLYLLVLTKTNGLLLAPSTLFLVIEACGFRRRASLTAVAVTAAAAAGPWCVWYFLLVRPHYRADYQYFFAVNRWPQPTTLGGHIAAYWYALHGTLWISPVLCLTAAAVLLVGCLPRRAPAAAASAPAPFRSHPLTIASLLAAAGTIFFAGMQNHPQPRYYEMVIYPVAFLVALGTADLVNEARALPLRLAGACALAVTAGVCVAGTLGIVGYARHPEYTWLNAANNVARYIDAHPAPNRRLLSVSGEDIRLMTHLPSLCDDYGTWDLPYRIHVYDPAWYAAWNELDPGTEADLETQYSIEQVASFPAFDDPDRDLLILYRLYPLPPDRRQYMAEQEQLDNAGK